MRPFFVVLAGIIFALWMSAGRFLFGIGGSLTIWYISSLGFVYVLMHAWVAERMILTKKKNRKHSRGLINSLILSWAMALVFGIMVPDYPYGGSGELVTIATHFWGDGWYGMAIALSNTFGILTLTFLGSAIGFAISDSRDPNPYHEQEGPPVMVDHPMLQRRSEGRVDVVTTKTTT